MLNLFDPIAGALLFLSFVVLLVCTSPYRPIFLSLILRPPKTEKDKRIKFEEFLPILERVKDKKPPGTQADYIEGESDSAPAHAQLLHRPFFFRAFYFDRSARL